MPRSATCSKVAPRENHILYNRLTDEVDGRASYELEFPNGGIAYVIGNLIEQSKTTENPNMVSFGAEGYKHPANELYLINNTLIDRRVESGYFLAIRPGFNVVKAWNNLLLGKRPLNTGGIDGEFINNPNVTEDSFVMADRNDFRIRRESPLHRTYRCTGARQWSLADSRARIRTSGWNTDPGDDAHLARRAPDPGTRPAGLTKSQPWRDGT